MNPGQPASPLSIQTCALAALATQLNSWRSQRAYRRAPIPQSLRQKAVELLTHYPRTQIIKTLGISCGMLKSWENTASAAQKPFVCVDLGGSPELGEQSPLDIVLANNRGQRITLQGEFSPSQMTLLVRAIKGFTGETYP